MRMLLLLLALASQTLADSADHDQTLIVEDDERTPSYPKLRIPVRPPCLACVRLVDNFDMGLLPALRKRHQEIIRHHSRSRLAASATVGELEAIVETEVERICTWPRTHHNKAVRRGCARLVEEHVETLVGTISRWARDGSYGLHLGDDLRAEVRPALCGAELDVCTASELDSLGEQDADERAKIAEANQTGHVAERPMVSEGPHRHHNEAEHVLVRVTAQDFHDRIVDKGAAMDYLVYMYFPGRTGVSDDTHARLRPKFMRLAEFLDAPGSHGALGVGFMDCVFNTIPFPHGAHVHTDVIALYPAYQKNTPAYFLDLRDGNVEIHELINFVFEASALEATKRHVAMREEAAGPRVVRETLMDGLLGFEPSLDVDVTRLKPVNITRLKEEL